MQVSTATEGAHEQDVGPEDRLARLMEVVEHVSHLLPEQGPITVFIHHNTLHAFEDLPFHEGVAQGARVFGCQPYLAEERYRDELRRGRIRFSDLQEALEHDLNGHADREIPCFGSRIALRLAMLQYPLLGGPTEELLWYVAETDALRRVRRELSSAARGRLISETRRWVVRDLRGGYEAAHDGTSDGRTRPDRAIPDGLADLLARFGASRMESWAEDDWESFTLQALWRVCCDGVRDLPNPTPVPPYGMRHRDMLLEATGVDTDAMVNEAMIRFCAAFLDQGMAPWSLPGRDEGFYRAFCSLYRDRAPSGRWTRGLARELARLQDEGIHPLMLIADSLDALGVTEREREEYLSSTLLALRGWAGMVRQIERRADRAVHPVPGGSLSEFLAVRLLLDRFALSYTAETDLGIKAPVASFWRLARGRVEAIEPPSVEQRAFAVFQLAQVQGLSPDVLYRLDREGWATVVGEVEAFTDLERRRIFQIAYERRFYTQTLDAVALHARGRVPAPPGVPRFQAVFCLDEREESVRRHLEEVAPEAVTYSTAGFYAIAMYYRGAADAHYVPLCPAVVRPRRWVVEDVVDVHHESHKVRARARRAFGLATHRVHLGSRSFALGAVLAAAGGVLASVPLIARTLFPMLTSRVRRRFRRLVLASPTTRLRLERAEEPPGPRGGQVGFTVEEMAGIAEKVLRETGLTSGFSRLVLLFGHGSTSMNNPHESAHDCGACGGARGGPNGRAMAQILNDRRVREWLARRGLVVPDETFFVGGMHNTSSEVVTFYDLDLLPASHLDEFNAVRALVERACDRDAHERSRRFRSAPLTLSFAAARLAVEARTEDLAQVRPEWGHATNAISIVGRRETTRGLFLDRRAFLTSYDPAQDDADDSILTAILSAVVPVCAGINLEYYFSYVDNDGQGSGTEAAAQHRLLLPASSDVCGQRPADRPALADGRDPRAGPPPLPHRNDPRGDAPNHGPQPGDRPPLPQ